jgi:hypothetical protein
MAPTTACAQVRLCCSRSGCYILKIDATGSAAVNILLLNCASSGSRWTGWCKQYICCNCRSVRHVAKLVSRDSLPHTL